MTQSDPKAEFWKTVLRAVEVEPRPAQSIRGASGFLHPVVAVGVDESRRRVVVISGESDARSAALAHGDIQAALPSLKVMMARPVVVNLGEAARILSEVLGRVSVGQEELDWLSENQDDVQAKVKEFGDHLFERAKRFTVEPFSLATVNFIAAWKEIVQQLALIEIDVPPQQADLPTGSELKARMPTFHLTKLIALDPAETDRLLGVCSIPLYEFDTQAAEVLHSGRDVDAAREILRRHHILQYFFPSADQLTLGLAERVSTSPTEIVDKLVRTPEAGHPFGQLEIVDAAVKLPDMIAALQERGLLVEGEAGVEITDTGRSIRAHVRFKPREGLLARLANVLSVKIELSLKDLFK